jgi:hypothetical protein
MSVEQDMQMLQLLQQAQANQGQMQPNMQQMPPQMMQEAQMPMIQQRPNPLEAGSRAAVEAAKRSLEMSDNENRRALGKSIISMLGNMYNHPAYGKGLAGAFTAMGSNIPGAIEMYDTERDRIRNLNYMLSKQQKEEVAAARKEEREMKKMAHEMEMQKRHLNVSEGYYNLEKMKREDEKLAHAEMAQHGAHIPLSTLPTSAYNRAMAQINTHINEGESVLPGLDAVDNIERILTDTPEVTKHWGTILTASQMQNPGYVNQQLGRLVPDKIKNNAALLSKNLVTLYASKLKGFPGRSLTAYLENQLKQGMPNITLDASATKELIKGDKKFMKHKHENGQEVYRNLQKGIYYVPKPMEYEEPSESTKNTKTMTPEEAEARKAQLRQMLGQG